MHGGAAGSGAPNGERNGSYKHGMETAEARQQRREIVALVRLMAKVAKDI